MKYNSMYNGKVNLSIEEIAKEMKIANKELKLYPINAIIGLFSKLAKEIIKDRSLLSEEGTFYLASWLSSKNLAKYYEFSFPSNTKKKNFEKEGTILFCNPRGLVSHWVAGNVPTLSFFSLVQSLMCKNYNIMKISADHSTFFNKIISKLNLIEYNYKNNKYKGDVLVSNTAFVTFPHGDNKLSTDLSMNADFRVIWGGEDAVKGILSLPQREHCETAIFGPKYSFAIADEESLEKSFSTSIKNLALDIFTFDQQACSSPHVLFLEISSKNFDLEDLVKKISNIFTEMSARYPKKNLSPAILSRILDKRSEYYLNPDLNISAPHELDWTILLDFKFRLEEPIGSRTLFVKIINNVLDVPKLVTKKVQTVGALINNRKKLFQLSNSLASKGVSRVVPFGQMNNYDTPWDGIILMHRLVRYTKVIQND